jgi:hypothetical protein
MNEVAVMESEDFAQAGLDDTLGLVGLPSQRRAKSRDMSATTADILNGISEHVDSLVLRAIAAQDSAAFVSVRDEVIGQYFKGVKYLAGIARMLAPEPVVENALNQSFCELEADFRDHALARFGLLAKEQAMFTVWTLRRTSGLISKIAATGPASPDLRPKDIEIATAYTGAAIWTQFHLDCLVNSIRHDRPIQLEVLPKIIDGLRAAVNAYGLARQGLDLRQPRPEVFVTPYEWDEEDKELLESSMSDMAAETVDA